jgi:hypothetical protein
MKRLTGYLARGVKQDKLSYQGPPRTRAQQLELTRSQILHMNQQMKGVPIQLEHNANIKECPPVILGKVVDSRYSEQTGDWEVAFELDDTPAANDTANAMKLFEFHSLSLSHDPTTMKPVEVSICMDPARKGSSIKELNRNSYNVPVNDSLHVIQATMQQQPGLPTFQNAGNYPPPPGEQAAKQLNQQLAAHQAQKDQPIMMETKTNDNQMDTSSGSTPAPNAASDPVLEFVKNRLGKGLTHAEASKLLESNIASKQQFLELESKNLKQAEELERSRRQAGNQSDNMVNILSRLVQKFGKSTHDQKAYQPQDVDQFRQNARAELQQKGHFAMDGNVLPQLVQAAESAMTFVESKPDPGLEEFNSRMALALKLEEQRNQLKRQYQANQEPWQQQSSSSSSYKQQQQPKQGMVEASAFGTMTQRYGDDAMNRLLAENERLLNGNGSDVGFNFSVPTAGFDQTADTQGAARKRKFTGAY